MLDQPGAEQELGQRIRSARKAQGRRLQAVADEIGISIGQLSQIERGLSSPSVRTLRMLCRSLDLDGASLFRSPAQDPETPGPSVVRRNARPVLAFPDQRIVKFRILSGVSKELEAYQIDISVGGWSAADLHTSPGQKFVYVLAGTFRIEFDDRTIDLAAGDTCRFDGARPHRWGNPTGEAASVVWVSSKPVYG